MERLAHLTETDIRNGVLNQMLAKAGIPDVQEYVQKFHEETENKIVDDWQHSDPKRIQDDELIAPPADVQSWITGLRLRLDDPVVKPPQSKPSQQQQQQQPPQPTSLTGWMQGMAPVHLHSSTDITTTQTDVTPTDSTDPIMPVAGNLGTWLTDWSRNLAQQPPPTSLDTWLKGLVSDNLHEPIGKAASSKGRLNSYLNAAQQVLSEHGYNVPNQTISTNNVETKTGMFSNVKQMYFLVSSLAIQLICLN